MKAKSKEAQAVMTELDKINVNKLPSGPPEGWEHTPEGGFHHDFYGEITLHENGKGTGEFWLKLKTPDGIADWHLGDKDACEVIPFLVEKYDKAYYGPKLDKAYEEAKTTLLRKIEEGCDVSAIGSTKMETKNTREFARETSDKFLGHAEFETWKTQEVRTFSWKNAGPYVHKKPRNSIGDLIDAKTMRDSVEFWEKIVEELKGLTPPVPINYVNLTPHAITVAGVTYEPSGTVARIDVSYTDIEGGVCHQEYGGMEGLPEPEDNTRYIVSGLVFAATDRPDVVAPATGHPDVERNDKGHIVSVPAFIVH